MRDVEKVDALAQLAATVAHELNNIFTAVSGNISLLEDSLEQGGQSAKIVRDVIRTAHRGMALSEQLQAFAGRQKLNRTRFDLNQVVAATFSGLKGSILRHVEVELGLSSRGCVVVADESKFARVLEELARNAATAMEGRGRLLVSTTATTLKQEQVGRLPSGPYIRLSMKDFGPGMHPEVARRAFDPVFSTRTGHHGWGLARCAGFIRQSGGDIALSSTPGKGATADLFLPRVMASSS